MTISKRIGLGFTGVLAITALLGGLAIWNMKSTGQSTGNMVSDLKNKFIPESQLGDKLKDSVARATLNIRSYALTDDEQYLTKAKAALEEVNANAHAAQELSKKYPELTVLKEHLVTLLPALQAWEDAIQKTEAAAVNFLEHRNRMTTNAANFTTHLDQLVQTQEQRMAADLKDVEEISQLAKIEERTRKLSLVNAVRNQCSAIRILASKSQALRDTQFLERGLKEFDGIDKNFADLNSLLKLKADIDELGVARSAAADYKAAVTGLLDDMKTQEAAGKIRAELGEKVMTLASEFSSAGMQRAINDAEGFQGKLSATSILVVFGLGAALLVGIGLALVISRAIARLLTQVAHSLGDSSMQLTSAANQVAANSQSLAEGASEQAASLEETSSSLEEVSSMTRLNTERAHKAKQLATQTRETADAGVNDMEAMNLAMDAIRNSGADIAKIIKTIDEIAFQTNILALNAAVEAARAGDAGMGFAVVAEEVRNLAQRSAQAARETANKIEGAISKTEQGVQLSSKVSAGLREIVEKVRKVDDLVAEVASASNEQSQGITQVNSAISEMDKVTQSNAANAEESASAAEELNAQAEALRDSVEQLLVMVGEKEEQERKHIATAQPENRTSIHSGPKLQREQTAVISSVESRKKYSMTKLPLGDDSFAG